MALKSLLVVLLGAVLAGGIALASSALTGPALIAHLAERTDRARDAAGGAGIAVGFTDAAGWLTRHPTLTGGEQLAQDARGRVATAIAATAGVGAVHWRSRGRTAAVEGGSGASGMAPRLHCQTDVEAVLDARTVRFTEASATIDPGSNQLLDEIAAALRPCVGSIIAITGHTDTGGDPGANLALSQARAEAVRWALIGRGIPADGLRAAGVGDKEPIARLDPGDTANRRIDFSVIASSPVRPTPVDTPGAG